MDASTFGGGTVIKKVFFISYMFNKRFILPDWNTISWFMVNSDFFPFFHSATLIDSKISKANKKTHVSFAIVANFSGFCDVYLTTSAKPQFNIKKASFTFLFFRRDPVQRAYVYLLASKRDRKRDKVTKRLTWWPKKKKIFNGKEPLKKLATVMN